MILGVDFFLILWYSINKMNDINKLQENIYREQTERVKRWHELVAKVKELKKIKKALDN